MPPGGSDMPAPATVDALYPTHICLDCGAVGYAGGYHDHGGGSAGDTASIAVVLDALRRGGQALDAIREHKDGNTNMSLTNLKLWEALDA